MKKNNRIWICLLMVIAFVFLLVFTNSCKKDNNNNSPSFGTLTDIDSNVYRTVTIGTQTWMAENLKVTHYRNGELIGTTTPATKDISGESTPKYQWAYNGSDIKEITYGRLYTWYAVTDSRNIAPTGWHIPSDEEWYQLTDYLGGEHIAGSKMKETGVTHWKSPNTKATNESGFTALPGGFRFDDGMFTNIGFNGHWWSSTEKFAVCAMKRIIDYDSCIVTITYSDKNFGFSVRCVKD